MDEIDDHAAKNQMVDKPNAATHSVDIADSAKDTLNQTPGHDTDDARIASILLDDANTGIQNESKLHVKSEDNKQNMFTHQHNKLLVDRDGPVEAIADDAGQGKEKEGNRIENGKISISRLEETTPSSVETIVDEQPGILDIEREFDTDVMELRGLKLGRCLSVNAAVQSDSKRLLFQLQDKEGLSSDMYLRIMICPSENKIYCNAFLYESWGATEEFTATESFQRGDFTLNMEIHVTIDCFIITINNFHIKFGHRVIPQEMDLAYFAYTDEMKYVEVTCPKPRNMPCEVNEPAGLRSGHIIHMDVRPQLHANSFQYEMSSNKQKCQSYCGFITEVKFDEELVKVSCRAFKRDTPGEIFRIDGHLPIFRDYDLDLKMVVHENRFEVLLDNDYFMDYDHSLNLDELTQITVAGDISVYGLDLKRPKGDLPRLKKQASSRDCCERCVLS